MLKIVFRFFLFSAFFLSLQSSIAQTFKLTDKIVSHERNTNGYLFGRQIAAWGEEALIGVRGHFFKHDTLGRYLPTHQNTHFFGGDVDLFNNRAIVGGSHTSQSSLQQLFDSVFVYEKNSLGIWQKTANLIPSDIDTVNNYGYAVGIHGDVAAVGDAGNMTDAQNLNPLFPNAGAVFIFEKNSSGVWVETQKILPNTRSATSNFGHSVSLFGNILLIGAHHEGNNDGAVYVFKKNAENVWVQTQKLTTPNTYGAVFGYAVDFDGVNAIIGAPFNRYNNAITSPSNVSGAVYIYHLNANGLFGLTSTVFAPDGQSIDFFGKDVSIYGDYAIAGSYSNDLDEFGQNFINYAGAAYIISKNNQNNSWAVSQKLVSPIRTADDAYGYSVAMTEHFALVGASGEDEDSLELNYIYNAGAAYIYRLCQTKYDSIYPLVCDSFVSPSMKHTWYNSGFYRDTLLDKYGCDSIISVFLTVQADSNPLEFTDSTKVKNIKCHGDSEGEIHLDISGGIPPYQILWDTGDTTQSLLNLKSGNYSVHITDSLGCVLVDTFKIEQPPELVIDSTLHQNISCYGQHDGQLYARAKGGTPPYSYSWSTGATTKSITDLSPGQYTVSVTDSNGCFDSTSFKISEPDSLTIELIALENARCNKGNGKIEIQIFGGTEPYQIDWNTGDWGTYIENLKEGVYNVNVIDENGCAVSKSFVVQDNGINAIFFANSFTPNEDGINDLYEIVGDELCYDGAKVEIYDRWGEKIFASESPFTEYWDGTYRGEKVPQGNYTLRFVANNTIRQISISVIY